MLQQASRVLSALCPCPKLVSLARAWFCREVGDDPVVGYMAVFEHRQECPTCQENAVRMATYSEQKEMEPA